MSEYMERHTVSRLIGAPPGYVGFDQGGLLTDGVDQTPHCVLLLDEIEKAHPEVFNILLQVMDHGKLTDHNGKQIDFRNVILIMTTNAGAADLAKPPIGFGRSIREGEDTAAINQLFSPEFRNRLDATISFSSLPPEIIRQVVHKFVYQLEGQLSERGVAIELSDEAADWLAERGFDPKFGARPLARQIAEHIKKPLADELLFGRLEKGGTAHVFVVEKEGRRELAFEFKSAAEGGGRNLPAVVEPKRKAAPRKPRAIAARKPVKALPGPRGGAERSEGNGGLKVKGPSPVPSVPLKREE
jgi:ATP-dependent Clp protease ATP-binding subunit ClpA